MSEFKNNNFPSMIVSADRPTIFTVYGKDGRAMASVKRDGSVEYHGDYSPDNVAKTFWDALARWCPARAIPAGWTVAEAKNPLGGKKPAMRLIAPDGRSDLFGDFAGETIVRDFLMALLGLKGD